ncbi:hypothetical protein [Phocoenobacter uteri]|uniref:hypothetical protein n=1 Tax=Phocoenobacter uteri TaxID=146806 RepID=UPI000E1B5940|nr:hypothetical protein [Phocoenobacter uteri]
MEKKLNKKENNMKKLIILGHQEEDCKQLENWFIEAGMQSPSLSKINQMSPKEMTEVFKKLSAQEFETYLLEDKEPSNAKSKKKKQEIDIHQQKMAEYLMMDFNLANLDSEPYCWEDSHAIDILDKWYQADRSTQFVILYRNPSHLFSLDDECDDLNDEKVLKKLSSWLKYNTKVCNVINKYPKNTVLINFDEFSSRSSDYIQSFQNKFLLPYKNLELLTDVIEEQDHNHYALQELILTQVLMEQVQVRNLYQKLQSKAGLPSTTPSVESAKKAWKSVLNMSSLNKQYQIENEQKQTEIVSLNSKLSEFDEINKELLTQSELTQKEIQSLTQKSISLSEFNQNILSQLNETQNVLENLEKDNSSIIFTNKKLETDNNNLMSQTNLIQNEILRLTEKNHSLSNHNYNILLQLNKTQEILEDLEKENNQLKTPPILGADERVKHYLTYRLGNILVNRSNSLFGIWGMPFFLWKEYRDYKGEKKYNKETYLPLHKYADSDKAEKLKEHLSYKIGEIFLSHIKKPHLWFVMPYRMCQVKKKFKTNN